MSDPLIDPDDLATYLNDPAINVDRAAKLIADAQLLCETVISPLPAAASVVLMRVAKRAYEDQGRQAPGVVPGIGYAVNGGDSGGSVIGDVYLTRYDIADLRRMNGGGGAFSIDLLPAGYTPPSQFVTTGDWDQIP